VIDNAPELSDLLYYFALLLSGRYAIALQTLWQHQDFKVQTTFLSCALVDLGIMPTRYQYLSYLQKKKESQDLPKEILEMHLSECFDYQGTLYFLVYQLQLAQDFATEAICLIRALEDTHFMLEALANFVVKGSPDGSLFSLVLESDKERSFMRLTFENNAGLTLRHLLNQDDKLFTTLIDIIVSINEDDYMNVLLLDKVNRREKVLERLI
jgi:hypothetical protein